MTYLEHRTPASPWCTTRHRGDLGEKALRELGDTHHEVAPDPQYRQLEGRERSPNSPDLKSGSSTVNTVVRDEKDRDESQQDEILSQDNLSSTEESSVTSYEPKGPLVLEVGAQQAQDNGSDIDSEASTLPNSRTHITAASSVTQSTDPSSLQSQLKDFISLLEIDLDFRSILDSAPNNNLITLSNFERFSNMAFMRFGVEFCEEHGNQPEAASFLLKYSYVISSTVVWSTIQQADVKSPMKRAFRMNGNTTGLDSTENDMLSEDWLLDLMATTDPQLKEWKSQLHHSNTDDRLHYSLQTDSDGCVDFGAQKLRNLISSSQSFHRLGDRFRNFVHPKLFQTALYFLTQCDLTGSGHDDPGLRHRLTSLVVELSESRPPKLDIDLRAGVSRLDAMKLSIEEWTNVTWSWWPLSKPRKPLKQGQIRLSWTCVSWKMTCPPPEGSLKTG